MSPATTLRIATRRSPLALWQAEHVAARLREIHTDLTVALVPLVTQGDRILDSPLANIGGKGLFVKELEQALLEGRADLAVHSMKDVPAELPSGLHIPVFLTREDPRDAFVSNRYGDLHALPTGARVGTSSLRRQCQIHARRPDLEIALLRGNVGTRLKRLDDGDFDAILLAAAGLKRLGLAARITAFLEPEVMLPAVGQGVIGIECREDADIERHLAPLHDPTSALCIAAERAFGHRLGGSCQVPLAAHATHAGGVLHVRGLVGAPKGGRPLTGEVRGPASVAADLGLSLADDLLARGARALLDAWHAV